jgi:Amt family ammonium transporter
VVTWLIAKVPDKVIGLRVTPEADEEGVDVHLHAESAYDLLGGTGGAAARPAPVPAAVLVPAGKGEPAGA